MKMKRYLALAMALLLSLSLASCASSGEEGSASVQSVAMLMGVDLAGNSQYGGVVEAKATVKVNKDDNKTVDECFVEVGDEVQEGDPLFTYDTDALELTVSSAELEVEQIQNSIVSYENQIKELEKEKKKASSSDKLSYTLQIQEAELNKAEAEYNLKQKQAELARLKETMDETEVTAPVSGIIQAVNSEGSSNNDYYGYSSTDNSYITIMETGTYRIKGTVGEEAARSLYAGMEVTACSRTDSTQTWHGVIESVNTSAAEEQNQDSGYYYDGSNGQSSAKYAFYVTLDNSDGLLIGQHVYLKVGEDAAEAESEGIYLPSGYLVDLLDSGASVWADNGKGKLELRKVTLGAYSEELDEYEITDGLTLEDYIAYPDDTLKEGMSVVKYDDSSFTGTDDGEYYEDGAYVDGGEYYENGAYVDGGEYYEDGVYAEGGEYYEDSAYAEGEEPVDSGVMVMPTDGGDAAAAEEPVPEE
ncbi:MAG: efflux RND transporter periplasmic adaptor subunit [Candidatus Onthomonas sp.]